MTKIETTIYSCKITITNCNIYITDSYKARTRKSMNHILDTLREYLDDSNITMNTPLDTRSNTSITRQWITHNNLYKLGLCQNRDLEISRTQKWYVKILYTIGSLINLNK